MIALCALLVFSLFYAASSSSTPEAGNHINIWIIAHSHDDTGWTKTVDQYYVEEVRWILSTATEALLTNQKRKFTYVEMAYFDRWWNEATDEVKQNVLKLLQNGQLQLNLAGWCMNDEGDSIYSSDIDQMTVGALFAMKELHS
eukprot:m.209557 g.209557  ORF g.209557 m.209557 type:complete len:143 (+) comp39727_c0_seq49:47-475(+)